MAKDLEKAGPKVHQAEIVHHGEKLVLPEKLSIEDAIALLYRRAEYLDEEVQIAEKFDVFPLDGAYGLSRVLINRYGWQEGKPIKTMFGERKPQIFKIASSVNDKVDVPWGQFTLPNVKGTITTSVEEGPTGRAVFGLAATVKRKDAETIRGLFDELRAYLAKNSLYRGKAIKIRFRDDDGDTIGMPEPEFLDVGDIQPENLILQHDLEVSLTANLYTPITRVRDCLQNGIKVKRGILLGGPYGTGKTLAAFVAAKLAQDAGITYVYTPRASELSDAVAFAKQYQSPACVVFCEDIDRSVSGERSVQIDDILNILDGIETKNDNIITVLTTNALDNINQAMLRPGRLDAILDIEPPDEEAAQRLVRFYGGQAIPEEEDLTEVGRVLAGEIPAVIEETVKRAKLFQLTLLPRGAAVTDITSEALHASAKTMTRQIDLLKPPEEVGDSDIESAMKSVVVKAIEGSGKKVVNKTKRQQTH